VIISVGHRADLENMAGQVVKNERLRLKFYNFRRVDATLTWYLGTFRCWLDTGKTARTTRAMTVLIAVIISVGHRADLENMAGQVAKNERLWLKFYNFSQSTCYFAQSFTCIAVRVGTWQDCINGTTDDCIDCNDNLSPYKYIFQSFGDCGTPPALNPLILILYDSHTQNTPLCQFWTGLVQYSSSYQRLCHFLPSANGVSKCYSLSLLFQMVQKYALHAHLGLNIV
jgi:hypothetical protein